ncbi:MAG: thermonuclease family protein [Candidatus Poribacteria bacterium]
MKSRFLLFVFITILFVAIFGIIVLGQNDTYNQSKPELPKIDPTGPRYKVLKIIDGDTILLLINGKSERVRLKSVDTPETVNPNKPQEYYGWEATMFITNLLKGEEVYTEIEPGDEIDIYKIDIYNRKLFYLFRAPDGLFVNLEIVRQGYGKFSRSYLSKYKELFEYYEEIAKKSEKGIWSNERNIVYVTEKDNRFHIYRCKNLGIKAMKKEEAIASGYIQCDFCKPGE